MRGSEISIAVGALDGHCVSLQGMSKLSTSAFSITAVVDADAVEFQGEMREWRRTADGGNINGAKKGFIEEISGIEGIDKVEIGPGGLFLVHPRDGFDPTDTLIRFAQERNWGLQRINPASLEAFFAELTKEAP